MLHLTRRTDSDCRSVAVSAQGSAAVLLFGAGLIGRRISVALARRGWEEHETPTPWHDADALARHLGDVEDAALRPSPTRIDLVWSAGRAGFSSDEEQTRGEEANFRQVLDLAARLERSTDALLVFHLISSAGGLFEGQRHVDASSRPAPRRPYGVLKLRLERLLTDLESSRRVPKRIYRLASVFGPSPRGGRRGLVPVLLYNTRERRPTSIVGQLTTLRDYVWTEDIARHLAEACTANFENDTCEVLASGKPTTIHEIVHHVRRVVHRVPALVFSARRDNATDITFAPEALPARWNPTDLETAIYQLHRGVFAEDLHGAGGSGA